MTGEEIQEIAKENYWNSDAGGSLSSRQCYTLGPLKGDIMTDSFLDKLRKRTKKNYKRFVRKNFIKYMCKVLSLMPFSVQSSCCISAPQEHRFILWLVAKKLERQGFQYKIIKGVSLLGLKDKDGLIIKWNKNKSHLKEIL